MKTIGLLGGTAWISTIEYYKYINQKINEKLGKHHSAKIILNSIDYEEIKQYNYENWEEIGKILKRELIRLDNCKVDCILICNNTLHKALNDIQKDLKIETPIFHIVDCIGEKAKEKGFKNLLLIGTKFTMENGFYQDGLSKYGLNIIIPNEEERNEIQRITQEELAKGIFEEETKNWIKNMVSEYDCEALIVGCTELPLIVKQEDYDIPVLDASVVHCGKAINFVLN